MVLRLLIDAVHTDETRVVIADNSRIHDFDFVTTAKKQVKGNIYLAKITRVEPSLQAAFVEYGGGKQGFLPFAEIHPDYYQIPVEDRKRLLEEAEADGEAEEHAHEASLPTEPSDASAPAVHDANDAAQPYATAIFPEESQSALPSQPDDLFANLGSAPPSAADYKTPEVHSEPVTEAPQAPEYFAPAAPIAEHPAAQAEGIENAAAHDHAHHDHTEDHAPHQPAGEPVEAQEIETLASDEDAVRSARPASFNRRYKIQEVIKRNQIVLVQVIKEERGNKGVSLTTFISLAGRYCVLMPNSPKGGGISRKIMSGEDRKRLKEISAELKTARGMSAIIRTAGIDRTRAEIKRDYEYLVKLWETIREQTLSSTAPALIYEEGDVIKRTIRDLYSAEIEEIIVEGEEGYNQAKEFMKTILPSSAPRVKFYQENVPLFYAYNIEDQLASMYDPIVKLRSGGYIVINPTEALISIDVNSGRMTGERNIEETASKTNLEAAQEIARQLRLRDLAGLIVIDFIDMMDSRNRRAVERALKDSLKLDRAKIQLGRISPFGLLEMSRQRLRPSISEASSMPCPHCQGKGLIRSDASVAIQLVRAMEKEAAPGLLSEIRLTVPPSVALHLLNARRDAITALEKKFGIRVVILTDLSLPQGQFRLEKIKNQAKRSNNNLPPVSVAESTLEPLAEAASDSEDASINEANDADSEILVSSTGEFESPRRNNRDDERPRRRGRRGGQGRRDGRDGQGNRDRNPNRSDRPAEEGANVAPEFQNRPEGESSVEGQSSESRAGESSRAGEPREPRSNRGERGGRRRRGGRFRDRRDRPEGSRNGESQPSYEGQSGGNGSAQASNANEPVLVSSRPAHSLQSAPQQQSGIPPLAEQASSDAKPKKGWWRKIIES